MFALLIVSGLLGKFLCDWELVLVSRAFFRGVLIVFWVCLGFLLPSYAFCGPPILLWGKVKVVGSDCCV